MHDIVELEGRGVPGVFVATVEFSDGAEALLGTDPLDPDTDGDLATDGIEVLQGTDP